MSTDRPPAQVPTLTEVVTWPKPPAGSAPPHVEAAAPANGPAQPSEGELVDRVLANLHRQVDLALEVKLREALAPVLARATDAIVREARRELTTTLRELVARAIAQELARRGQR